jgi:hypothetical protein
VLTEQKPTLEGEFIEGLYNIEGIPFCRGNPVEKPPDKPVEFLSSMGKGQLLLLSEEQEE